MPSTNKSQSAPVDRPARRREALARSFRKWGVDAFLVTDRSNVRYLTGFTGEDSAALLFRSGAVLLTDGRFAEQSARDAPGVEVVLRKRGLMEAAAKEAKRRGASALGVEAHVMTLAAHGDLASRFPGEIVQLGQVVEERRQVKDADEKRSIRRAVAVAEEAFALVRPQIRPGMTERKVAAMLDAAMRDLGAEGPSFPTIVAFAERASLPHAQPGERALASGDAILFDWGARVEGYCSDLTRMLFIDTISSFYARIYDLVFEAQGRALRCAKAGLTANQIDAAARDFLKSRRHGKHFSHGLGHGIGLDVHEGPAISWRSKAKVKAGMVFTVEPGVYLPGRGGVRIEDDVLVVPGGAKVLTSAPKSLRDSRLRTRA